MLESQRLAHMEDDDEDPKPSEAKDYYNTQQWWPQNEEQAANGFPFAAAKHNSTGYNLKEITMTPQIPREGDKVVLGDMIEVDIDEVNDEEEHYSYSQPVRSEIEEIVEEGKSKTVNQESRGEDIYVAVGKDDLDVVKWALDHTVPPTSRIFLIHVSPPIALIPPLVGNLPRSQLNPQQVDSYVNNEIIKMNNMLRKYIQLSNDAQVTAEMIHVESNDTAKAILDLIPTLNIKNLVMGIEKPPHSWGKNKLSRGEIVKQNAPDFCELTLVYVSHHKHHSSGSFLSCICSGGMNEEKD